jgi:hypothetical protein
VAWYRSLKPSVILFRILGDINAYGCFPGVVSPFELRGRNTKRSSCSSVFDSALETTGRIPKSKEVLAPDGLAGDIQRTGSVAICCSSHSRSRICRVLRKVSLIVCGMSPACKKKAAQDRAAKKESPGPAAKQSSARSSAAVHGAAAASRRVAVRCRKLAAARPSRGKGLKKGRRSSKAKCKAQKKNKASPLRNTPAILSPELISRLLSSGKILEG